MQLVITVISTLSSFIIGIFVFKNNRKSYTNILFTIFCFALAFWAVANYLSLQATEKAMILFWMRVVMTMAVIISISFFFFIHTFPGPRIVLKKRYIIILLTLTLLTLIISFTPFLFEDVLLEDGQRSPVVAPGMLLFLITAVGPLLLGFILLIKRLRRTVGLLRIQFKYIFLGSSLMFLLILVFNFFLVVIFGISLFVNWGPFFVLPFIFFTTYAIVKYRLMDIRLVIKGSLSYILSLLVVVLLGFLLMFNLSKEISAAVAGPLILIIGVALFQPVRNLLQNLINKYLFREVYSYQEALKRLSLESTTIIELDRLVDMIVDTLMKSMGLNRAGILLAEKVVEKVDGRIKAKVRHKAEVERHVNVYKIAKVIGFKETNGISLVKDNFLTSYLQKTRKAVVFDELNLKIRDASLASERNHLQKLQKNMQKIEAGMCLPLFAHKELIGLIVLGNKISGEAYTKEDIQLLETLANQASIAISNAQLYEEVKEARQQLESFNKILRQKVDEQTKHLKELLQMKSEFLTIASHQLRTPTSIVRGYLSMAEDPEATIDDKKKFVDMAYQGINRMERIIHDILSATELEGGKLKFNIQPIKITNILQEIVQDFKESAKKKGLELKYIESAKIKKWPVMHLDRLKIKEAITNLVANAICYTEKGEVILRVEECLIKGKKYAKIEVRDTGIGFSSEEAQRFTEKFFRAPSVKKIRPDGSGLGLYITKNIVKLSKGKFEFSSPGIGKGSIFTVYLPF